MIFSLFSLWMGPNEPRMRLNVPGKTERGIIRRKCLRVSRYQCKAIVTLNAANLMDQLLKHGLFYNYISNMDEQLTSGRDNGSIKTFICSIQREREKQ